MASSTLLGHQPTRQKRRGETFLMKYARPKSTCDFSATIIGEYIYVCTYEELKLPDCQFRATGWLFRSGKFWTTKFTRLSCYNCTLSVWPVVRQQWSENQCSYDFTRVTCLWAYLRNSIKPYLVQAPTRIHDLSMRVSSKYYTVLINGKRRATWFTYSTWSSGGSNAWLRPTCLFCKLRRKRSYLKVLLQRKTERLPYLIDSLRPLASTSQTPRKI